MALRASAPPANDEFTEKVIGVFFSVYRQLGYGFLESVYSRAMELELVRVGLHVVREAGINVVWGDEIIGSFRADFLIENRLILELKAGPSTSVGDHLQLCNYLKAAGIEVGLLLHFGPRPQIRRVMRPDARMRG